MEKQRNSIAVVVEEMCLRHEQNEKWGTAALYRSVLHAICDFCQREDVSFEVITPSWLKSFEGYLRAKGLTWNSVSTYMRILRAVYHEAVMTEVAPFKPYIFNKVYTGVEANRENALNARLMKKLIKLSLDRKSPLRPALQRSLQYFVLMFMLRGLPFVDLSFLKKSECKGNTIAYRRKKTGRHLVVKLDSTALLLLKTVANKNAASPYLFPIIHHADGSQDAYKEYQAALKLLNKHLAAIGKYLKIEQKLSSYTARHTWATMAFICNVNPAIISQSMGHSSIKVTETYLKPFQQEIINEANRTVLEYVMG
ncbi:MAG: site-specific integrase [Bacteroidaceae bacterium]|nr:site-specific integrase [Bacteroidaceae bacterium]